MIFTMLKGFLQAELSAVTLNKESRLSSTKNTVGTGIIVTDLSFISDIRSDVPSSVLCGCKPCFRGVHACIVHIQVLDYRIF